jgi:hypothetical protein
MLEYPSRIIVNNTISNKIIEKYNLKHIKYLNNFCHIKLVGYDGEIIDNLLVDKQSGKAISMKKIRIQKESEIITKN